MKGAVKPLESTHEGKLDEDQRRRRVVKNARNKARVHPQGSHGLDMPVKGSQKR